jgi:outer membrane immunogenic protein
MRTVVMAGLLTGAVLAGAMAATAVVAADLGPARPIRPPADFAPPFERERLQIERWTGFYIGGTLGYGLSSGRTGGDIGSIPFDLDGGLATVFAGYNWQQGALVLGLETDVGTGWLSVSEPTPSGRLDADLNVYGSARARLGALLTPSLLLYGTAGLAWASMDFNLQGGQSRSETFLGYQVGLGGEMMISRNVTLRLEYNFTDLGAERVIHGGQQNVYDPDFHTVRAGISLRF